MALPGDDLLYLYLADALDPGDRRALELRLGRDPGLRARLRALQVDDDPALVEGGPTPTFRIPPPGFGLHVEAGQPRLMGPSRLRVGDRFQIRLEPRSRPEQDGVVVLRDLGRGWEVLLPTRPEQAVALARLPIEADGRHRIDLIAGPPAGWQRWAVALLPIAREPQAEPAPPWERLHCGLAAGEVPVGVVEIELV